MSEKVKIIISDTHIGAGGADMGNKLEDFISDEVFFQWIHGLIEESEQSNREMTLIINGDWIEFLQTPEATYFKPTRHYSTQAYTNISEKASIQRLEVVHAGHPLVFQALADFIALGPPRRDLVILFGNHDPELAYPGVQERLLALLEAQGSKRKLVRMGERRYLEDGVLVEHGNAFTEAVNQFTDPDHPFDPKLKGRIERPPGSYVVTDFYNKIEWERPWIDGVHPMSSLVFYALAYDPLFAVRFVKALLISVPDLLTDILATGAEASASQQVLAQLAEMDERALAQRLGEDAVFAATFAQEVGQALAEKGAAPSALGLATAPGEAKTLAMQAREIAEHYWQALEDAAGECAEKTGAKVVCFGHIHERVQKRLPNGAIYLNTGTWIWKMDFSQASDAMWRDLIAHPEKYMHRRHLTYARIDIAEDGRIRAARLLLANDPPGPAPPPGPGPEPTLWQQMILGLRELIAKLTKWV